MLIHDSDSKCQQIRFSLIVEQILAFASSPKKVRELKILSPNFKQIVWRCFTLLNILVWIGRAILLLNSKQFHKKVYSNSLHIADIT